MALHRVVVTTQVGHEAEAQHDDVVIVRLAVGQTHEATRLDTRRSPSFVTSRSDVVLTCWSREKR